MRAGVGPWDSFLHFWVLAPLTNCYIHCFHELLHYLTTTGFVFNYCVVQFTVWTVLHAVFLLWGVRRPFSYQRFKNSGRIVYAHIVSVILGVIVPIPSALLPLIDGYVVTATPTIACAGRNLDITYYTFILPMSVTLGTTSCLLVLIVWTIFKVRRIGHRHNFISANTQCLSRLDPKPFVW